MSEARSPGSGAKSGAADWRRLRRRMLLGILALLLGVAAWWGPEFREAAALSAIHGAIADHDWTRAESLLRAGIPVAPKPSGPRARAAAAQRHYLLGRVARRQRRFAEADRAFERAAAIGWSAEAIARQRLLARAQRGEVRAVEEEISGRLAEGADDAFAEDCYEALAEGFIDAYRINDARECLDFWSRWQPGNPLPSFWMGVIEERFERPVMALEYFTKALAINPRDHESQIRVARLELDMAKLDDAQRHFRECLEARPDDPRAVMGLADCLLRSGDRAAARDLYHDALTTELTPEQAAVALTELGQLALEDGDVPRGAVLLDQAVTVDPRFTRARLTLAGTLLRLGDEAGATLERETAQRLAARQRRLAAITYEMLSKPDAPELRAEAGTILLEEGFEQEGLQWLEGALRIDPEHGPSHRVLADHYASLGDLDRAATHRRAAGDAQRPGTTVDTGSEAAQEHGPEKERPAP
ncbi:MAG: tetratricopeptide repeat protein [Planctomycetaceae bacterium]|nr:tetratricopeptide repeat protein [Planctomycetaceae bacterium]